MLYEYKIGTSSKNFYVTILDFYVQNFYTVHIKGKTAPLLIKTCIYKTAIVILFLN